MSLLPENCPLVCGFNGYSDCTDGMSPVTRPSSSQRKSTSFIEFPSIPAASHHLHIRHGKAARVFYYYYFPSSDSLRLWTSKGVWGKYSSPERWPLTAGGGETAPNPFNKHLSQSRSSALIVSLLMRASCSAAFPRLPSQLTLTHAWLRHYTTLLHDGFNTTPPHALLHSTITSYLYPVYQIIYQRVKKATVSL